MAELLNRLYKRWSSSRQDTRTKVGNEFGGEFDGTNDFLGYIWASGEPAPKKRVELCLAINEGRQDSRTQIGQNFEDGYVLVRVLGYVQREAQDGLMELRQRWSPSRQDTRTQVGDKWEEEYYTGKITSEGFIRPIVKRKNFIELTADQRNEFVAALRKLHSKRIADSTVGRYDSYVDLHAELTHPPPLTGQSAPPDDIHYSQIFLPWHREFLLSLEQELQAVSGNPMLTIPYWDWTVTNQPSSVFTADFMGVADTSGTVNFGTEEDKWVFTRFEKEEGTTLPNGLQVMRALAIENFSNFSAKLFSLHSQVHSWVGGLKGSTQGTMKTGRSPNDPLFFLHHAYLDHLWAKRQESGLPDFPFADAKTNLPGPPKDKDGKQLCPQSFGIIENKADAVKSIFNLGYEYE